MIDHASPTADVMLRRCARDLAGKYHLADGDSDRPYSRIVREEGQTVLDES